MQLFHLVLAVAALAAQHGHRVCGGQPAWGQQFWGDAAHSSQQLNVPLEQCRFGSLVLNETQPGPPLHPAVNSDGDLVGWVTVPGGGLSLAAYSLQKAAYSWHLDAEYDRDGLSGPVIDDQDNIFVAVATKWPSIPTGVIAYTPGSDGNPPTERWRAAFNHTRLPGFGVSTPQPSMCLSSDSSQLIVADDSEIAVFNAADGTLLSDYSAGNLGDYWVDGITCVPGSGRSETFIFAHYHFHDPNNDFDGTSVFNVSDDWGIQLCDVIPHSQGGMVAAQQPKSGNVVLISENNLTVVAITDPRTWDPTSRIEPRISWTYDIPASACDRPITLTICPRTDDVYVTCEPASGAFLVHIASDGSDAWRLHVPNASGTAPLQSVGGVAISGAQGNAIVAGSNGEAGYYSSFTPKGKMHGHCSAPTTDGNFVWSAVVGQLFYAVAAGSSGSYLTCCDNL